MSIFKFFSKRKLTINATNKKDETLNINEKDLYSKMRLNFTPEHINVLSSNEVFVFGSNLDGHHGGGAARTALNKFGAISGQGVGLQGQSYGIPTMHDGIEAIAPYVNEFIDFAIEHPKNIFYVTRIGCGIAGFKNEEIAPLFKNALNLDNVYLPKEFVLAQVKQPERKIIEKSEKNKPLKIKLSNKIIGTISAYDIIYAEITESGAMGCAGQIMFYIIKEEQLVHYSTNLFQNKNTYMQAEKFLLSYQNTLKSNDIQIDKVIFDYYYGGFGNHVFINKNVFLKIVDQYFAYTKNNKEYHIYSSVLGVFDGIVYAMKYPKEGSLLQ